MDRRTCVTALGAASVSLLAGCGGNDLRRQISGQDDPGNLTTSRSDLVDTYQDALTTRNDGIDVRRTGIEAFNDEAYERSIGRFETAVEHFETAAEGFAEAVDLARDIGEEDAASACETAEEESGLQLSATQAAFDAAIAARDGSGTNDVNEHVETYRDRIDEAEEIDVAEPQALADVLQSE